MTNNIVHNLYKNDTYFISYLFQLKLKCYRNDNEEKRCTEATHNILVLHFNKFYHNWH